jgi:hypothetical protein
LHREADREVDPEAKPAEAPNPSEGAAPGRGRKLLGPLLLVLALPPVSLAMSAFTGFGLEQNFASQAAFAGALCAVILPALGLASIFGASTAAHGLAFITWSVALMMAFPGYLPERREPVTRIGLEYLSGSLDESTQQRVVETGLGWLRLYGSEPERVVRAERRVQQKERQPVGAPTREDNLEIERQYPSIAYDGDSQAIVIPAHVDGPNFGETMRFIFDTGATLTTMSRDSLDVLDIQLDDDAPTVLLRTASGELEARLALVDAIWLEEEVVEWVTVAVCESCANATTAGLLGLNVSSHFRVSIDHESERIEFVPRRGRRNRRLDVQPWLDFSSVLRRWDDGRLELTIDVTNRARQGIRSSVLEVKCSEEDFTIRLDPIPAFGSISQTSSLPRNSACESFAIRPLAASWETGRF